MADNIQITAGSGTTILTDDCTTGHAQIVKLAISTDGSATLLPADGTDGLLVNLGANNDVVVSATNLDIRDLTATDVVTVTGGASQTADVKITLDGESVPVTGTFWQATQPVSGLVDVEGDVAHDAVDSGNPLKLGAKASSHGANPTAVADGDRTHLHANRHGILWTIGGHPNVITRSVHIADANGAQNDVSIVGTIAAGTKVVVTAISVTVDSATTAVGGVAVKIGFGATTIPADSTTGANGVLLDHPGIAAGSGIVIGNGAGILGIGGDGEELRLTSEDPVGGNIAVTFSYYTIES